MTVQQDGAESDALEFLQEHFGFCRATRRPQLIQQRLQPRQLLEYFRKIFSAARAQLNELHTELSVIVNCSHLAHCAERRRIDANDHFGSHPTLEGGRRLDTASAQTQVTNFRRNKQAARWKTNDLRLAATREARAVAPILVARSNQTHVVKIVDQSRILEKNDKIISVGNRSNPASMPGSAGYERFGMIFALTRRTA